MTEDARQTGVRIRREMFGADTTDRQIAQANRFTEPMQHVVSRYCFGETWSRPGLARRERSMVTLGVLCAMGRPEELRVHVKGALANGVSPLEIREILLHTMVYAGVPLGVDAFRNAARSLAEEGVDLDELGDGSDGNDGSEGNERSEGGDRSSGGDRSEGADGDGAGNEPDAAGPRSAE